MKYSAGIVLYRMRGKNVEVFLVHPGGPYWEGKDVWGIPKGEFDSEKENPIEAAVREFEEEVGFKPAVERAEHLGCFKGKHKSIYCWAIDQDYDGGVSSNVFELEWPKGSGNIQKFPEVDKGMWMSADEAMKRCHKSQVPIFVNLIWRKKIDNKQKGFNQKHM